MCALPAPPHLAFFDESYLKSRKLQDESLIFLFLWHEGYRLTLSFQDVDSVLPLAVWYFCTTICLCVRSHCGVSGGSQLAQVMGNVCTDLLGFSSWTAFVCLLPSLLSLYLSCFNSWLCSWLSFILISLKHILKWKWPERGGWECWEEEEVLHCYT